MTTRTINDLLPVAGTTTEGPLTVAGTAVTITSLISGAAWNDKTDFVRVSVETDQLRIDPAGGTPTATRGDLVNPGQKFWLTRHEADIAKVIRVTASAVIQVTQFRSK